MPGKNDMLFAFIAIAGDPDLSGSYKTVAAKILKHFNRKTGQCDPGTETLARLANVTRKTVITATDVLHERGLIHKISHGGHSHRASYQPNWEALRALAGSDESGPDDDGNVKEIAQSTCKNFHIEREGNYTQTNRSNQLNKPIAPSGASGDVGFGVGSRQETIEPKSQPKGRNGLLRGSAGTPLFPPSAVVRSVSHQTAAEQTAIRRWGADLMALGRDAHAEAIERMTPELQDEATAAEMRCKGGGLRYLMDSLGPALLAATRGRPA